MLVFFITIACPAKKIEAVLDFGKLLRSRLEERRGLLVPGAADALAARVIASLGSQAIYVTGAGVTNTSLGSSDLRFISCLKLLSRLRPSAKPSNSRSSSIRYRLGNLLNVAIRFRCWSEPARTRFKSKIKYSRSAGAF